MALHELTKDAGFLSDDTTIGTRVYIQSTSNWPEVPSQKTVAVSPVEQMTSLLSSMSSSHTTIMVSIIVVTLSSGRIL